MESKQRRSQDQHPLTRAQQRREREKQELKQAILTAAREIAIQEGWQAVTVRKVAERIEYSPPMIYEYFENKEDILIELHKEGFSQLVASLKFVRTSTDDHEECLLKMAEAYWDFAWKNPELYQVMLGLGGIPIVCIKKPVNTKETFGIVRTTLNDWIQATGAQLTDLDGSVEILQSIVHGMIALTMVDRITGGQARAKQLMLRTVQDILIAWRTKQKG